MNAYDRVGRIAISFSIAYLRRRYRRQIRIGAAAAAGLAAVGIGAAAYAASRNVPEG